VALTGAALASLGKSGTDVKSPVCLIVVPSRELGVQIALQMYQLVGGDIRQKKERSSIKSFLQVSLVGSRILLVLIFVSRFIHLNHILHL
jgi:superfamily II DNA/RNA helicase